MSKHRAAVVFVHGLSRKPSPLDLKKLWLWGLDQDNPMPTVFEQPNPGIRLGTNGVASQFCYYADVFYGNSYETDFQSYYEAETSKSEIKADALLDLEDGFIALEGGTPREQGFLRTFEARLGANLSLTDAADAAAIASHIQKTGSPTGYEIAGLLPPAVRRAIIKKAAMEAYYFLFDKEFTRADGVRFAVRRELRTRLLASLRRAAEEAEKVIIVAHSMGTMVAYDVLRNCPECSFVDTMITVGSPLGIREVQQELLANDARSIDFPAQKLGRWINVYDPVDPICGADPRFANDFQPVDGKAVVDVKESNWGSWRHTITHYFSGTRFRNELAATAGISRSAA